MKRLIWVLVAAFCCCTTQAQLLTWTPPLPAENDAAQMLAITVDAAKGNKGLFNYTPTNDVYVHIGVITNLSSGASDWKYSKFSWGTTNSQAQATYAGNNQWQFTITGSLRTYFGITNPNETIQKIAILFRNGNGSQKQANSDGSDMYIPVYGNHLAVRITQPAREPKYIPVPETQNWTLGSAITMEAATNKAATIKLYHNSTLIASGNNKTILSGNNTISVIGLQQLIAEASDGAVTVYDTINIFVAPTTAPVAPLPAGATVGINYGSDNTSATLVLQAPDKKRAIVIGDFTNWQQNAGYIMNQTPDGQYFWLHISNLTPGTEYAYQYIVDDTIKIADPYTEKVLDPDNDRYISAATYPNLKPYPTDKTTGIVSILQTAAPAYNWSNTTFNRPDKRGLVIYELLVRDFLANHNWNTLRDTLSYLKRLGINAIEIMPLTEFEGNNSWGYNGDFYMAPDKYYGPENTLKEFIDSCHNNGIAVIMDIALNHQFGQSPMVQLYWDVANNRPAANSPWFNPVPKHPYNVGYDMNHESAATHYFVSRVVAHWLKEYKVDGFRFDLSKGFTQKQTCDDKGNNCNVAAWSAYDASRVAIWKGYYDTVQTKSSDAYVILEHFADNTEEKELSDYGALLWGNLNYNYAEASMGYVNNSNFSNGIYTVRNWTKPHLVTYMESHDEERIQYKNEQYGNSSGSYTIKEIPTGLKRIELNAAFFFTLPGPKMLWQFGELGYDYPINYCEDGTVNDNCRTSPKPIKWDYWQNAGRKHVYNEFSDLIKLRFHPWYKEAFINGRIEQSLSSAFKWIKVTTDTSNILVVGNFDVVPVSGTVTFQSSGTWYDYLNRSTYTATGTAQTISLQPGEFHVFINRNVNNITATPVTNIPATGTILAAKVYPNPVKAASWLELYIPQSSIVTVNLLNSVGQDITVLQQQFLIKGNHTIPLTNISHIRAGNYYLTVYTKNEQKTIPVSIQ